MASDPLKIGRGADGASPSAAFSAADEAHGAAALAGVAGRSADIREGWHTETLYDDMAIAYRVDETLYDDKSKEQQIRLIRNQRFGRMLFLDGVTQTTEADEFIYHEMLAHTPLFAHGAAKRVLIVGGGDGGMLRECLKHDSVASVTMVEIDKAVVEFSKKHLPSLSAGAFDDPRLKLVIGDGAKYMAKGRAKFDVIIVDRTDPIGPGLALYTDAFYADCRARLKKGGILVTQNGVPFLQPDELRETVAAMRKVFEDVSCYIATVPTYVGGPMAFGWAGDGPRRRETSERVLRGRFDAAGIKTRYYTPEVHRAAFALPPYIGELVA